MDFKSNNLDRVSRQISSNISTELDRVGIFHRIYFRTKTQDSIRLKFAAKDYDATSKKMQDIIGVRVNLYFADDIEIIYPYLKSQFHFVDETIDKNEETVFKPTRINLIFKIPKIYDSEFVDTVNDKRIDNTFELQIRTILSEGWHEVDHDLRYKCKPDWRNSEDLGRMFNGVLASLEASEWTTIQIFQNLAYRHYKLKSISSMLRSKFRIRIIGENLNEALSDLISKDDGLLKALYKIERTEFLAAFLNKKFIIPVTLSNIIYLCNNQFLKCKEIDSITPEFLKNEFAIQ
jgi:putative GTP pyrophosphokinase